MNEIQRLPDRGSTCVEEKKIRKYLLDLTHPEGKPKAEYFIRRAFKTEAWETLRDALIQQGITNQVVETKDHKYGKRYVVECSCITPDLTNPCIRSVWEVNQDGNRPRLITAHVF
jgi:hypothetical protein